jgi:hypothetical protein
VSVLRHKVKRHADRSGIVTQGDINFTMSMLIAGMRERILKEAPWVENLQIPSRDVMTPEVLEQLQQLAREIEERKARVYLSDPTRQF